ncbi:hypothetical protein OSB04_005203 [Centaurea solstitialis]|uniref:Uncharacterized protein n=1 Tax=Centaurea solstitialis TaxID=347529 RepID=A0AA38TN63_9ASTR|nr:hypothetical protein OSB04_005203 [Centaurea solstitialis]
MEDHPSLEPGFRSRINSLKFALSTQGNPKSQCFVDNFEWVVLYSFVLWMRFKVMTTTLSNEGMDVANLDCPVFRKYSADSTDEYVKIGESTVLKALKRFCRAIVEVFGERYL